MKRFCALLTILALTLCLFGCQKDTGQTSSVEQMSTASSEDGSVLESTVSSEPEASVETADGSQASFSPSGSAASSSRTSGTSEFGVYFHDKEQTVEVGQEKEISAWIRPDGYSYQTVRHLQIECTPPGIADFSEKDGKYIITGEKPGVCTLRVTLTAQGFPESSSAELFVVVTPEGAGPTRSDGVYTGGLVTVSEGETKPLEAGVTDADVGNTDYYYVARTEPEGIAEFQQECLDDDIFRYGYTTDHTVDCFVTGKKPGVCTLYIKAVSPDGKESKESSVIIAVQE